MQNSVPLTARSVPVHADKERSFGPASWSLGSFLVLALVIPLSVVDWSTAQAHRSSIYIAVVTVLYSSLKLALLLGRGRPNLMEGTFWIFTYVFMGLAMLAQLAANRFARPVTYTEWTLTRSGAVVLFGLLAYDLGRTLASKMKPGASGEDLPFVIHRGKVFSIGILGILAVVLAISQVGLTPFFTSRYAVEEVLNNRPAAGTGAPVDQTFFENEDKSAGRLYQSAVKLPVFISLYMLLIDSRNRPLRRRNGSIAFRFAYALILAALVMSNFVANNPIANGRFAFGLVLIGFASIFFPLHRERTFRLAIVSLLLMFVFIFSALDGFRRTQLRDFSRGGSSTSEVLVARGDYSMTQQNHDGINYVDRNDHSWGRQILGAAFVWVPRRIWSDKPIPTGALVSGTYQSKSSTLWTEGYVDFGYLGVVVIFTLYGWVSRRLDVLYLGSSSPVVTALMPLLAGYQFYILRGSLIPAMGGLFPLLFVFALCLRHTQVRSTTEPLSIGR
jgi:uncharacterized membrane protein